MDNLEHSPSQSVIKEINKLLDKGSVAVVITLMTGLDNIGSKLLVQEDGKLSGSLSNTELDSLAGIHAAAFLKSRYQSRTISVNEFAPDFSPGTEILLLFERLHPAPRLVVCGAGHVGAALAKLGSFVGYRTTLIDDRSEFLNASRFPNEQIELVLAANWSEAVQKEIRNGRGVSVAVVTRGHNEDEECMKAIIATNPDYVGLIGSKRRTNIVLENLRRFGATEDQLKKVRAPIGLDIGAVSPEEVALAIIAEIVAERHNRSGASLSAWRRG